MRITHLLLLGLLVAFSSCIKPKHDNYKTSSRDNAVAETAFNALWAQVEVSLRTNGIFGKTSDVVADTCATVTLTGGTSWPKTLTIDFGSGCTGTYGTTYKGKIIATITDKYINAGSVITITPVDLYVNGNKIEGTKTITNNGKNSAGNITFSVIVANGKITTASGDIITWQTNRVLEWIEGANTQGWLNICDDVYLITGNITGTNREGNPFSINITSPLRKEICCGWIVSGELEIIPDPGQPKSTIDFGNGDCDKKFTLTVGNKTYIIDIQ